MIKYNIKTNYDSVFISAFSPYNKFAMMWAGLLRWTGTGKARPSAAWMLREGRICNDRGGIEDTRERESGWGPDSWSTFPLFWVAFP